MEEESSSPAEELDDLLILDVPEADGEDDFLTDLLKRLRPLRLVRRLSR